MCELDKLDGQIKAGYCITSHVTELNETAKS